MRKTLFCLAALLACTCRLSAADDLEQRLQRFDQTATPAERVGQANDFFRQLYDEQLIDTLLIYSIDSPADTVSEQMWYWAAECFYDQQQYALARQYAERALPLYRAGNDRTGEADCLNLLAISSVRKGSYEAAVGYALQCYRLDEASGDADRLVSSLNLLAGIYIAANLPAEAEQYLLKGLQKAEVMSNPSRRSVLLGTASEVYHALGNDEQALSYADDAYQQELALGRDYKAMVRLSQKASVLIGLHRYDDACHELSDAIPYFRQVGDRQSQGISCNKMGMALHCLGREHEAVDYFRQAAAIFVDLGDKTNEMHSRKGLYECLWKQHPDSAKLELERFNELKDSLYQDASAESLARFNAEFGNDWLRHENEAERAAKRQVLLTAIIVISVLLVVTLMGWWLMRRRQRRQHTINEQLSANIDELREKYKELSVRYDNALVTSSDGASRQREELSPTDREFLEKAVDIVNELMYAGQVDAESLAARQNMSLFQLRQRLSALTGETPQAFIANIRMRRARYLLDNRPELNVGEVAQLCAYNDTPNFSRAFKKTFGISPTQYIEKQRQ